MAELLTAVTVAARHLRHVARHSQRLPFAAVDKPGTLDEVVA